MLGRDILKGLSKDEGPSEEEGPDSDADDMKTAAYTELFDAMGVRPRNKQAAIKALESIIEVAMGGGE